MLDILFESVYSTVNGAVSVTSQGFFLCTVASLVLGLACAFVYMYRHSYSKNFVVTLALLPVIVQVVIMLVNGNIGAGIAVMGVFNLVRFRSIAGTAKDIGSVFLAMAVGLATGMGYIGLAVVLTLVVAVFNIVYIRTPFAEQPSSRKVLKITVPEDLEFEGVFDRVLSQYTAHFELASVSTTNMGSLYQLQYNVTMRQPGQEKRMIDELRCLNGNLKISLGLMPANKDVL